MSQTEINNLEMSIEQAEALVERGRITRELLNNPIFQKIVDEGYLLHEAARLANMVGDPNINDKTRADVQRDLTGPSTFRRYITTILQIADLASHELDQARETLSEVLAEDNADSGSEYQGDNL